MNLSSSSLKVDDVADPHGGDLLLRNHHSAAAASPNDLGGSQVDIYRQAVEKALNDSQKQSESAEDSRIRLEVFSSMGEFEPYPHEPEFFADEYSAQRNRKAGGGRKRRNTFLKVCVGFLVVALLGSIVTSAALFATTLIGRDETEESSPAPLSVPSGGDGNLGNESSSVGASSAPGPSVFGKKGTTATPTASPLSARTPANTALPSAAPLLNTLPTPTIRPTTQLSTSAPSLHLPTFSSTAFYVVHFGFQSPVECDSIRWSALEVRCGDESTQIDAPSLKTSEVTCEMEGSVATCYPNQAVTLQFDTKILFSCTGSPVTGDLSLTTRLGAAGGESCPPERRRRGLGDEAHQPRRLEQGSVTVPFGLFQFLSVGQFCFSGNNSPPTIDAAGHCVEGAVRATKDLGWFANQEFCVGEDPCLLNTCVEVVDAVEARAEMGACYLPNSQIPRLGTSFEALWNLEEAQLLQTPLAFDPASPALWRSAFDTKLFHEQGAAALHVVIVGIETAGCSFDNQVVEISCENPGSHLAILDLDGSDFSCSRVEANTAHCVPQSPPADNFNATFIVGCSGAAVAKDFLGLLVKKYRTVSGSCAATGDSSAYHWLTSGSFCPQSRGGPMALQPSHSCESTTEHWPSTNVEQTYCLDAGTCVDTLRCEVILNQVESIALNHCATVKEAGLDTFQFDLGSMKEQVDAEIAREPNYVLRL